MKKIVSLFMFSFLFAGFPDYYYKLSIKQQQKEFSKILKPMIDKENSKILAERQKIIDIFNIPMFMMNKNNMMILSKLAKKYNISDIYDKQAFLKKIDIIPEKLVLAQAAIESAWGRSYFVRNANNMFGEWDYSGKGMIPRHRDPGKTHTIRIFKSLEDSLASYMRNLNRNPAYKEFRDLRYKYRKENKPFDAMIAATALQRYSELGKEYVRILQLVIKNFNKGK